MSFSLAFGVYKEDYTVTDRKPVKLFFLGLGHMINILVRVTIRAVVF